MSRREGLAKAALVLLSSAFVLAVVEVAARVVVHHSEKDQWSVTLWAWGACRT